MTVKAKKNVSSVSWNMAFVVGGGVSVFDLKTSFLNHSDDLFFPAF